MREIDPVYYFITTIVMVVLITLSISLYIKLSHIENMAKAGYQECLEEGKVLWQKECYKID